MPPEETPVELIANPNPKAGWKTSEFWLVLGANLVVVTLYMIGSLDGELAAFAIAGLTALYNWLRIRLKVQASSDSSKPII